MDYEVPDHAPMTRRVQFKIKSTIKQEKQARKGKGKGADNKTTQSRKGKGKGKVKAAKGKGTRGKGKGSKIRKSKSMFTANTKKRQRATLLASKAARAAQHTPDSDEHEMPSSKKAVKNQVEDKEHEGLSMSPEAKTTVSKSSVSPKGKSAKAKAKAANISGTRNRKGKATKEAKQEAKDAKQAAKPRAKAKAKVDHAKKDPKEGKKDAKDATKKQSRKVKVPTTETCKQVCEQALEGKLGPMDLEVGADSVSPAIKQMLCRILKGCKGAGSCDCPGQPIDCPGLRYDVYRTRSKPAVGVRIDRQFVTPNDASEKRTGYMSAAYFTHNSCMGVNIALSRIFVPC